MPIEVGQEAPDFTLRDQNGADVTLSSFRGDKNVLLMFFPWAFSGICTGELCSVRDRMPEFGNDDTVTLAVSCDSVFAQKAFADREGYAFQLLSDRWPHGATAQAYGVFAEEKGAALRASFVIDKTGVVRWSVIHGIGEARNADDYAKALAEL
jgi:mycoredoxin-dependent peroxiredoxin